MTTGELHDMLAPRGAKLMLVALSALERGTLQLTPQPDEGATYAAKIDKSETRIDWTKPWSEVHDHCRGLSPFPGAWFELAGSRVKVLRTTEGGGAGHPARCWTISSRLPAAKARCGSSNCSARASSRCRRMSSCAARRLPAALSSS